MDSADSEEGVVFALAEVLRAKKLRQADELRTSKRSFADAGDGFVEVRLRVRGAGHLDEGYAGWFHS